MLAIQRPRMGSSQPSDGNPPFGYSFLHDDHLFLEPPEIPPGEPLLNNEEQRNLSSFFDQMLTSSQYSDMSFGEGLNFSDAWHGLPPQFMGTATSYGHHAPESMASSILDFGDNNFHHVFQFEPSSMPPPPPPPPPPQPQRQAPQTPLHSQSPIDQGTSASAAAVLTTLQNSHPARSNSINHGAIISSQPMGVPSSHPVVPPRNHFKPDQNSPGNMTSIAAPVPTIAEQRDENLFADMAFGTPRVSNNQRPTNQNPEDVRWGSDTSFASGQGYAPISERETTEALANERLKYMECLRLSNSAANSQPLSPIGNGDHTASVSRPGKSNGHIRRVSEALPRRRRKSKSKEDVEEDDEDSGSAPAKTARKRKSKVNVDGIDETSSISGTPGKRRKSNANGAKSARENLSDEQKRQNHILSEQKRRTLIKEGFEDLTEIIPSLKTGGYSKSSMLQIAGEWLEDLVQGNNILSS